MKRPADETHWLIRPDEYSGARKNPLKGFVLGAPDSGPHPYATLVHHYVPWNQIENRASDGPDKIHAFCDAAWSGLPAQHRTVIPRLYLHWPGRGKYWPADLAEDDFESPAFLQRAERLIRRLGELWDNDPRVAFVEIGIFGKWGENHSPAPSAAAQDKIGRAYRDAFRHKHVLQRYPSQFADFEFGLHWDSFGHPGETGDTLPRLASARWNNRWKQKPMGGEMAFDWGTPLGKDATDAVVYQENAIETLIRDYHWNHLGWISDYDQSDPLARRNAARLQQALGYRFVLDEAIFPRTLVPGKPFRVQLVVRNTGAAPFYYRWPLEIRLLRPVPPYQSVWSAKFAGVDIRRWLPGGGRAKLPASPYPITETFTPPPLPDGFYLLAVALPNPQEGQPAVRFAIENYLRGGHHPLGVVRVGPEKDRKSLRDFIPRFDDPAADES